ncbi:MAG: tyrosine-type recombinase/integrase [Bacillota bacterium]
MQDKLKDILGNAYNDNDLITCSGDGFPINPSTFSHTFARVLKRNNLQHIRFHDLRHTNATLMLKHNISPKVASERLGHSKINITLDLYSHVLKEMQEDAAIKIDNAIFNNDTKSKGPNIGDKEK